ncbi:MULTISPECIES: putative lipid II flippase FtsW [Eubacteriales]|uniref:Probable peptidoglycan glycosyltransferase FtsW n=2 Tax=Bittarella massiliensis (ex Durand et al. 2017) TaxID=1720313 RepID=A0AAQ1MG59_9FIRM|nr:cell division protein FtsW [Clostridium sp. ATCC 29733]SHG56687.1 cell division protein FtsW [Bittarella massiliensis (ex Durand et al. 2017)]
MKKRNRELRKQIREERGSGGQAVRKSGQMDTTFLVLVLVLVIFGLVMLFSASYAFAYYNYGNSFHFILRQGIFAVGGVTMMLAISKIDYHIYEKFSYILIGLSVVLLIVVLFMEPLNNARRWINLGFTTFQPSEVAKFAVIVLFAHLINVNYKRLQTFRYGVLPFMAVLAVICGLMVLEPHLSGTILIVTIGFTMMFIGGTGTKWFVMGGVAIVGALAFLLLFTPLLEHAIPRLEMWQNPFIDKQGDGWQTVQSLLAIGSGGVFGLGLGNSRQKHLYVPEPHNDFIFSILCEELGLVGGLIVIILFILLVVRGFAIAMKAKDKFGSMLALGLTFQVGLQALLNIAVVTNTVPNTGISLPFFSYGGTSLLMLLGEMGIVLSVSRHANIEKK